MSRACAIVLDIWVSTFTLKPSRLPLPKGGEDPLRTLSEGTLGRTMGYLDPQERPDLGRCPYPESTGETEAKVKLTSALVVAGVDATSAVWGFYTVGKCRQYGARQRGD
jgi:hypothetical protein